VRGAKGRVPEMAAACAQYEPVAWWWTRNRIGQALRELYEVPKELPPKLLALVTKLDAVEGNHLVEGNRLSSPRSRTLVGKLDTIEGKCLSRYATPVEPRSLGPSDDWTLCT
jgi:hypothetical protein